MSAPVLRTVDDVISRGESRRSGVVGFVSPNALFPYQAQLAVRRGAIVAPHRVRVGAEKFSVPVQINIARGGELKVLGWGLKKAAQGEPLGKAYYVCHGHRLGARTALAWSRFAQTAVSILDADARYSDGPLMGAASAGLMALAFSPAIVTWKLVRAGVESTSLAVHRPGEVRAFKEALTASMALGKEVTLA